MRGWYIHIAADIAQTHIKVLPLCDAICDLRFPSPCKFRSYTTYNYMYEEEPGNEANGSLS